MRNGRNHGSSHLCRSALVAACTTLSACSGGGGDSPTTTFAFATAGATAAEGAAPLALTVVLHTSLSELTDAVSVDVVDTTLGTATSGSDYAAFTPVTVTFPIGSVDGATQTVPFGALNDLSIEGTNETVRFALANATGGAARGITTYTATVTDVNFAAIQFALVSSTMPGEVGVPHEIEIVLDLPPATTLAIAATARFADAGGGSATSGVDYAAVAQQTISFPAGTPDGTALYASVLVLDDAAVETDETVRFHVSTPGAGVTLGANALHVMTIEDDDATSDAALLVTQGATGTEYGLSHNASVSLGTQTVAAGPNVGTLVRLSNAGGSPMDLGTPRLTGTNPNDFDVVIDSATMAPPPGPGEPGYVMAPPALAPFGVLEHTSGPGLGFTLDAESMRELAAMPRVTLHGFPVPGLGEVTLDLRRLPSPFAHDAVLSIDGAAVAIESVVGEFTAWSGSVIEMPGSQAFLSFSSEGARGFLELPVPSDRFVHLFTERAPTAGEPAACRIVRSPELAALGAGATPAICGGERLVPGVELDLNVESQSFLPPSTDGLTAANCRIAIETDYQLYAKFGSTPALSTYVAQLMSAISDQYFTDVQTTISIAYLGVHTSASDGWTSQDSGGDAGDLLDEFQLAWNTSGWPVSANLAHFISGASLGGGIAYVNVLCNQSFGYGVSGNVNGNINWGTWSGAPGNFTWDFVVVAHELGHNFGSSHTHSYCPPLDLCYFDNCNGTTTCSQGTIMSYCHTCGGMDNIDLEFHPVCANIMRGAVNASCLEDGALNAGDYVQYRVRFNPLTATGTRTANLDFTHDAPNANQPFRVQLSGTAQ